MGKRVRKFGSWADAEIAHDAAQKCASVLEIALLELALKRVKWLVGDTGSRRVGLCRLEAAHGGVVIIVEKGMVGARYLDEWVAQVEKYAPCTKKEYMPEYKAWLDIRQLAAKAKEEQRAVYERLLASSSGCTSTTPASIVDQNVRSY
jgi:hypothetical protein